MARVGDERERWGKVGDQGRGERQGETSSFLSRHTCTVFRGEVG